MKLWYEQPANEWVEALPLGNGRIGAMVFGGTKNELLSLNEDSLWSGYPRDTNVPDAASHLDKARELVKDKKYAEAGRFIEQKMLSKFTQSYLPLCDLALDFANISPADCVKYYRELSLDNATSTTSFSCGGVKYEREVLVSEPDKCMAVKLTADKKASISFTLNIACQLKHSVASNKNSLILEGICPSIVRPIYIGDENPVRYSEVDDEKGIRFYGVAVLTNQGGTITQNENSLSIANADSVVIKFFVRTSFNGFDKQPYTQGRDCKADCEKDIENSAAKTYDEVRAAHIADYSSYYNRTELSFGDFADTIPTDKRLLDFQKSQNDPHLYELIFQYGRYLLISSSREGTQPANLQGIWNKELRAPWSSNFTVNINTEMNYWHCETCNLSEMHTPLFEMIKDLQITGAKTAKLHYNARGFTSHHNVDIWRLSTPVGENGEGSVCYAFWCMSAGWLCQHLFEHYEFTLDKKFLAETAYPAIKGCAEFYVDILTTDENGYLVLSPSTSPENTFIYNNEPCNVSKTTTMTMAIVREIFTNTIKASKLLGIDAEFANELSEKLKKLFPYQIGSKGQLLEWDEEFEEAEIEHRHISHLYPLHPGHEINVIDTPEFAKACEKTLEIRGDVGTGWSLGWKINTWARLQDGNHALKLLKRQLHYVNKKNTDYKNGGGTYMNMFDAHPPFQIDGNFAASAGIAQMLLQSYDNRLLILPALSDELPNGYVKGLRAKGGILADISFLDSKLEKAVLTVTAGEKRTIDVIYNKETLSVEICSGKTYIFGIDSNGKLIQKN